MLVLGIESTAHTFGVGIIDDEKKKILFHSKSQYKGVEGMDLRKVQEFHVAHFDEELQKVKDFLISYGLRGFEDLDLISFSQGPGIGNSLKVGALAAKSLALNYNKKIVGVNHIQSHLEVGKFLTGFLDPVFLYVSGVNTQIIALDEFGKYRVYGETEDIGLGNLLDSFGRDMGFDFPSGPKIETLARKGKCYIELPYVVKGMNVSLAGMTSSLKQIVEKFEQGKEIQTESGLKIYEDSQEFICDLCYSLQETAFALSLEIIERAIAYTNKKEFLIVGGVAANQRLTQMAKEMCLQRGVVFKSFPLEFAMDNGAMIGVCGSVEKKRAKKEIQGLQVMPYITIEDVLE